MDYDLWEIANRSFSDKYRIWSWAPDPFPREDMAVPKEGGAATMGRGPPAPEEGLRDPGRTGAASKDSQLLGDSPDIGARPSTASNYLRLLAVENWESSPLNAEASVGADRSFSPLCAGVAGDAVRTGTLRHPIP